MDRATESNHWSFSIQLRKNMLGKLLKLLFEGGAEDWIEDEWGNGTDWWLRMGYRRSIRAPFSSDRCRGWNSSSSRSCTVRCATAPFAVSGWVSFASCLAALLSKCPIQSLEQNQIGHSQWRKSARSSHRFGCFRHNSINETPVLSTPAASQQSLINH